METVLIIIIHFTSGGKYKFSIFCFLVFHYIIFRERFFLSVKPVILEDDFLGLLQRFFKCLVYWKRTARALFFPKEMTHQKVTIHEL